MNLGDRLRAHYEAHMKYLRDKDAREDYVRQEGIEKGIEKGIEMLILDNLEEGKSKRQIIEKLVKRWSLSESDAEKYFTRYSK